MLANFLQTVLFFWSSYTSFCGKIRIGFGWWGVCRACVPFELFFPIPSLSTTCSLHRMRRGADADGSGSTLALGVDVSSPRSRRVRGNPGPGPSRVAEDSRDVSVSVAEYAFGVVPGWRDRDILMVRDERMRICGRDKLSLELGAWSLEVEAKLPGFLEVTL